MTKTNINMQFYSKKWFGGMLVLSGLLSPMAMAGNSMMAVSDADYPARNESKEELGKFLFYDKVLSGNSTPPAQAAITRSQQPEMVYRCR